MNISATVQQAPGCRRKLLQTATCTAVGFVAWYCIFSLPFTAASSAQRLKSTSYAIGFNNRIAIASVVLLIAAMTIRELWRRTTPPVRWSPCMPVPVARPVLLTMAVLYVLVTFSIYLIAGSADWYGLDWESSHFLWRLKLSAVYGLQPYTGYQFEYGPALAYIPIMIHRLLALAGATHEFSYYCSHFLLNVAGLFSIAFVLARAVMPRRMRDTTFIALGLASFLPNMGLNGVVLRYTAPFFGLALVHEAASCHRRWQAGRVFLSSIAGVLLCVALSAEIGITFIAVLTIYGVLSVSNRTVVWPIITAVLLAAVLSPALLPSPYYASLAHFSQGANNLPLLPTSPHLLLYLGTMIWIIPKWLASLAAPVPDRVFIFACGLLTVILVPGALGRCDPYHLLFYGLGSALLGFIYLSNSARSWFRVYTAVYLLVFFIGLELINVWVFRLTPQAIATWATANSAVTQADSVDLTLLLKYPQVALPYGSYGYSKQVQQWFWLQKKLAPEYFMGGMGIYTEDQVRDRLNDIGRFRYAFIPDSYRILHRQNSRESCVEDWRYLRKALLYPSRLPCIQRALDPDGEISRYLENQYHAIEKIGDYLVLEKNG